MNLVNGTWPAWEPDEVLAVRSSAASLPAYYEHDELPLTAGELAGE